MMTKKRYFILPIIILGLAYLGLWPIDVDPVAWQAAKDKGYTGVFQKNQNLQYPEKLSLQGFTGPEDIAIDSQGRIYAATNQGIVRMDAEGLNPELWAVTGGRPLGIDFDLQSNLIVADGYIGLVSISPLAETTLLTNSANGLEIGFADDVDVADNGMIYFSDASTKFKPKHYKDVLKASELDVLEHGSHGRLLRYNPKTKQTDTLIKGLNFANGVTLAHDQSYVLVNDMGSYRVLKYWIKGDKKGQYEVIIDNLPGFPDNVTTGLDNRFWISLIKPRNKDLDSLSNYPFLRKIATRLLPIYHPKVDPYAHIIAIDGTGVVLQNLQNSQPNYTEITSVRETEKYLYLGSLVEESIGRLEF
jgi:sugar lactone lactonase YvrE